MAHKMHINNKEQVCHLSIPVRRVAGDDRRPSSLIIATRASSFGAFQWGSRDGATATQSCEFIVVSSCRGLCIKVQR